MHAGTGEIADDASVALAEPQNDDHAARLIFPEEAAGPAADDHDGDFFFVRLHVDAGAVARVTLDVDAPAAHGVSRRVAHAAVNDDPAVVHRIAERVLRVALYGDRGAVEVSAERVPGNAFYRYGYARHAGAEEALAHTARNGTGLIAAAKRLIDLPVTEIFRPNNAHGCLASVCIS